MTLDILNFTPYSSFIGGVLIGLAASMLILLKGRVAGISGILLAAMQQPLEQQAWRLYFILGLLVSYVLYSLVMGSPELIISASLIELMVAGILVGTGTILASGCTSGHGVCGLSRLSPRSLVATLSFMLSGFALVYVTKHLLV